MRFVLCSLDVDILRAQTIIGFFFTHKTMRSEKPITWKESRRKRTLIPEQSSDRASSATMTLMISPTRNLNISVKSLGSVRTKIPKYTSSS